jgi:hypothetical protein
MQQADDELRRSARLLPKIEVRILNYPDRSLFAFLGSNFNPYKE